MSSLADLPQRLKNYKLGEMHCTRRFLYQVPCN